MIQLIQTEHPGATAQCLMCIARVGPTDKEICDMCEGFVSTYYKCPKCHTTDRFFGRNSPDTCLCGLVFTDLNLLKESKSERINYQLSEHLL